MELAPYFDVLLRRGYNAAFMCIEIHDDERFMQFSKYVSDAGDVGVRLDFPRAVWSEEYFSELQRVLESAGVSFSVTDLSDEQVPQFLMVDVGRELE